MSMFNEETTLCGYFKEVTQNDTLYKFSHTITFVVFGGNLSPPTVFNIFCILLTSRFWILNICLQPFNTLNQSCIHSTKQSFIHSLKPSFEAQKSLIVLFTNSPKYCQLPTGGNIFLCFSVPQTPIKNEIWWKNTWKLKFNYLPTILAQHRKW